ncbi:hypothetical protein L9F63_019883, partial [Diploptera punctata]
VSRMTMQTIWQVYTLGSKLELNKSNLLVCIILTTSEKLLHNKCHQEDMVNIFEFQM